MFVSIRQLLSLGSIFSTALLAACGGGGGGDGGPRTPNLPGGPQYTPGIYQPSSTFAQRCANPRTGNNPRTGRPYPDVRGSVAEENHWLRSWTNELYLWYSEVPDLNPASYTSALTYFDLMKTPQTTSTGQPKDKFHFTYDTAVWEQLSQSGVSAGYGAEWAVLASRPPRRIVVAYVEANSPAASAGLVRGDEVTAIDGFDAINGTSQATIDALNNGLTPTGVNQSHTFTLRSLSGGSRQVTLTSTSITSTPVQNVKTIPTA
jgi:hypothetical protein